jgi:glycosyltransferase involved in cell wall biosynthesis
MRIGLDARSLTAPRPRGTGRNLLDAYQLIPSLRPTWEFYLYHQQPLREGTYGRELPWEQPRVCLRHVDMPGDRFDAWFQLRLPWAARADHLDLLHLPANVAPAWCPVPFVATIHDLVPLQVPGELPPDATARFRRGVQRAVRRAVHLITPSAATRDAVHDMFSVPLERITVVPWAPDAHIAALAQQPLTGPERAALRQRYGLGARWLVSFAGNSRRKNATGVLEGFARVPPGVRGDVQLVLVGCGPGDDRTRLEDLAQERGVGEHCRILGFVPHEDLPPLLTGAAGVVIASLCEGFGLPILDAFACGVPVLAARVSSMPEVAGDAAAFCDPYSADSIAAGLAELLDSARAAELVARGRQRVRQFTWQRTAERVCAVYEQAARMAAARRAPSLAGGRA